ncbi:MAG: hypothetical protein IH924_04470 [Proteobacteria bacterium]|nr:hypothetical protein [Pseudomonadota bacterium]
MSHVNSPCGRALVPRGLPGAHEPGSTDKEEREFLPAARRALGAADWAEIDARLSQPEDPLFGAPTEERFAALRQDVLYWAQEARAQEAR